MEIINIKKDELNDFLAKQKHSQFLQSWEWGEFQEKIGKKVIRFGFEENGKIFFAITLIKNNLPAGRNYFYAPRIGIKYLNEKQIEFVFKEIEKIARKKKTIFLRFEPRSELKINNEKLIIKKTIDVQPKKTLILDIFKTEDEILKNMHQKTRYNIRLADKRGVEVREARDNDFDKWWQIMEETRARDKFRLHSREHYQKMLELSFVKLLIAKYKNEIIAGNIISFFGDMATYVHGASSDQSRNVMAPYLLQWEAIKIAKQAELKYYDFYGIDEEKWPGVSRFKRGFGGKEINYPGTFDLVFDTRWYSLYKILRKLRRFF